MWSLHRGTQVNRARGNTRGPLVGYIRRRAAARLYAISCMPAGTDHKILDCFPLSIAGKRMVSGQKFRHGSEKNYLDLSLTLYYFRPNFCH